MPVTEQIQRQWQKAQGKARPQQGSQRVKGNKEKQEQKATPKGGQDWKGLGIPV